MNRDFIRYGKYALRPDGDYRHLIKDWRNEIFITEEKRMKAHVICSNCGTEETYDIGAASIIPTCCKEATVSRLHEEPSLHALPGRVIVRISDRPTKIPGSTMDADSRYFYAPYIGTVLEIGDPLTDQQGVLAKELADCTTAGHRVIFTPGSGIELTTPQMRDVRSNRKNDAGETTSRFGWLAGLRIFRIEDFSATLIGGDELGGSNE